MYICIHIHIYRLHYYTLGECYSVRVGPPPSMSNNVLTLRGGVAEASARVLQRLLSLGFGYVAQGDPAEPAPAAAEETSLDVPTRIASPRGHDNKWWWDACDEGKILIQRCTSCETLRHPPRQIGRAHV